MKVHIEAGGLLPGTLRLPGTLHESGSGLPAVGEFVVDLRAGDLYRVVELVGRIQTDGPGWTRRALVAPADWADCYGEPQAHVIFDVKTG